MPPAVIRGLRLAYGSWKIICIRRRTRRSSSLLSVGDVDAVERDPCRRSARTSRSMARPVVLLPQPDSPTRPRVSPRRRLNATPSTARTSPMWRSTDDALLDREPDLEVLDPDQRPGAAFGHRRGSRAARRPSSLVVGAERQAGRAAGGRRRALARQELDVAALDEPLAGLGQLVRHAGQRLGRRSRVAAPP